MFESRHAPSAAELLRPLFLKGAQDAILGFLFSTVQIDRRYDIALLSGEDTGSWRPGVVHRVLLGENLLTRALPTLSDADQAAYIASVVRHQLSHLMWTSQDFSGLEARLKAIKAPFELYNLFEDARIEGLARARLGRPFHWRQFEPAPEPMSPSGFLQALIHGEGQPAHSPAAPWAARVLDYYYPAMLQAADSEALLPLIGEWVAEFPEDAQAGPQSANPQAGEGGTGRGKDLAQAVQDAEQGTGRPAEEADGSPPGAPGEKALEGGDPSGQRHEAELGSTIFDSTGTGGLLSTDDTASVDWAKARRIAAKLRRMLQKPARTTSLETPAKRLSIRHAAHSEVRFRHRVDPGMRRCHYDFVVDCSGSMRGEPIANARILVAAFNELARSGLVEGNLILSAIEGGDCLYERLQLPVTDDVITRIYAFGDGEGLQETLATHLQDLRQADRVFVITDAGITDEPIEQPFFHRRGVFPCGLYAGEDAMEAEIAERMADHFAEFIVRESVDGLAEALLARLRQR